MYTAEILTRDPLKYKMDISILIVSVCLGKSDLTLLQLIWMGYFTMDVELKNIIECSFSNYFIESVTNRDQTSNICKVKWQVLTQRNKHVIPTKLHGKCQ